MIYYVTICNIIKLLLPWKSIKIHDRNKICCADFVHLIFRFKDIPDQLEIIKFSSKKITELGFKFKYSLEDMFTGAVETCREKGILPKAAQTDPVNGTTTQK